MAILLDIVQSWLRWLLYSPVRFALIMAAVVVLIVGAIVVNRTTDDSPAPEAAAETKSASSTPSDGDTTPTDSGTEAPLTSDENEDAKALALDFVKAWAARPKESEKWAEGVEPYCTDELKSRMRWVDPRQSDDYAVEDDAPVRESDPHNDGSNTFGVLTDKGLVYVEVVKDEAGTLKANNVYTGVDGE